MWLTLKRILVDGCGFKGVVSLQTGTSVFLEALPPPSKLVIVDKDTSNKAKQLLSMQEALNKSQEKNTNIYGLKQPLVGHIAPCAVTHDSHMSGHMMCIR